jgi:hypothetical protein
LADCKVLTPPSNLQKQRARGFRVSNIHASTHASMCVCLCERERERERERASERERERERESSVNPKPSTHLVCAFFPCKHTRENTKKMFYIARERPKGLHL